MLHASGDKFCHGILALCLHDIFCSAWGMILSLNNFVWEKRTSTMMTEECKFMQNIANDGGAVLLMVSQ